MPLLRLLGPAAVVLACLLFAAATRAQAPTGLSPEERQEIERGVHDLQRRLADLRTGKQASPDTLADADVFVKGIVWALRYDTHLEPADVAAIKKALGRARERTDALAAGRHPWSAKKGRVARGYVSAVDGSTQPY